MRRIVSAVIVSMVLLAYTAVSWAGDLVRIYISPGNVGLGSLEQQQFAVLGVDRYGRQVTIEEQVIWSCDPLAGSITPEGLFTASDRMGEYLAGVTATTSSGLKAAALVRNVGFPNSSGYAFERYWGGPGPGEFTAVSGVAEDGAGNLYVLADERVHVFDSTGNFVRFWNVSGAVTDCTDISMDKANGWIYILDRQHGSVIKFELSGKNLGQWGQTGYNDNQLNGPYGIALDSSGNVYVADTSNHCVKKFRSDGSLLLKWGTRGSVDGQFSSPNDVAVDAQGKVYVADYYNNRVQVFDQSGRFICKYLGQQYDPLHYSSTTYPDSIAVDDSGNIYIADGAGVHEIDPSGAFIRDWDSRVPNAGDFGAYFSVCLGNNGNLYISDNAKHSVYKFHAGGEFIGQVGGIILGIVHTPAQLSIDSTGRIFLADAEEGHVSAFDANANLLLTLGTGDSETSSIMNPCDTVVNSKGEIFVTDRSNGYIAKYASAGDFLGRIGSRGTGNGQFGTPQGIAIDSADNIYVVESGNERVQKLDSDGRFILTWGGSGWGNGRFSNPADLVIDRNDNVYVLDTSNIGVQKFDCSGSFITSWGGGYSGSSPFANPVGIAICSNDQLFVTESRNLYAKVLNPVDNSIKYWTPPMLPAESTKQTRYIAQDASNNIYMTTSGGLGSVQKYRPHLGQLQIISKTTVLAVGESIELEPVLIDSNGNKTPVQGRVKWSVFSGSGSITQSGVFTAGTVAGSVIISAATAAATPGTLTLRIVAPQSGYIFDAGWNSHQTASLGMPSGVAVGADDNVFITDLFNSRVVQLAPDGNLIRTWDSAGPYAGLLSYPMGIAVDAAGCSYVCDIENNCVQKFDSTGNFLSFLGVDGSDNGQFSYPENADIGPDGSLYVTDGGNNRIQKFSPTGTYLSQWGSTGDADGLFIAPIGIAINKSTGDVYVVDSDNNRIQKFDPNGVFLTKWGSSGSGNGQFNAPRGVAVDAAGNVYVADTYNHRIQKFDAWGNFITKWGTWGGEWGSFSEPTDVAVDSGFCVYVADSCNGRIQKFMPFPLTQGQLKRWKDGTDISLPKMYVTAGSPDFTDCFYAETADKTMGIKVVGKPSERGAVVSIDGALASENGERVIQASGVAAYGIKSLSPMFMTTGALGGEDLLFDPLTGTGQRGVLGGAGLNNIGLLVKVAGVVTSRTEDYFCISDGSVIGDNAPFEGIKVISGSLTEPEIDKFISVTGICLFDIIGEGARRAVRPRCQEDIQILN